MKPKTYKTQAGLDRARVAAVYGVMDAVAARHFPTFLVASDAAYRMQWFHRVVAEKCQDLADGRIRRLMVFMPPQHGKSEIVSRKFPAWLLGRDPDTRVVCCSYSSSLSTSFSRQVQRTMQSEAFARIFPAAATAPSKGRRRTADYFDTADGQGFYKAVGVGGSLTGTPADVAIIDDPVKDAAEAYSATYRERVWDWYNAVLTTRLHNDSRQLFIMTRWHEDDLAGRILQAEPEAWDVVSIPAICEQDTDNGQSDRRTGAPLWQERHSLGKLIAQQARAPREFAALYQQHPVIGTGNIVRREWFRTVKPAEFRRTHQREPVLFFIDTAYTDRTANDPTGIIAACRIGETLYITAGEKVHKSFPDLVEWIPQWTAANGYAPGSSIRIEPKANGLSVIDQLRRFTGLAVVPTPTPTDSKETRLNVAAPLIEGGRVAIVQGTWTEEFLDEVCGFPAKPHDEYVDVLCYACQHMLQDRQPIDLTRIARAIGR